MSPWWRLITYFCSRGSSGTWVGQFRVRHSISGLKSVISLSIQVRLGRQNWVIEDLKVGIGRVADVRRVLRLLYSQWHVKRCHVSIAVGSSSILLAGTWAWNKSFIAWHHSQEHGPCTVIFSQRENNELRPVWEQEERKVLLTTNCESVHIALLAKPIY